MARVYTRDPTKHWSNQGYVKKVKCERCSSRKQLCVHHRDRDRKYNHPDNLETLCRLCHIQEHREEVASAQRRSDVNKRRGEAVSAARTGNHYEKLSKAVKKAWRGEVGARLREKHKSPETVAKHSEAMRKLMNDPAHIEKRRQMKEARRANS